MVSALWLNFAKVQIASGSTVFAACRMTWPFWSTATYIQASRHTLISHMNLLWYHHRVHQTRHFRKLSQQEVHHPSHCNITNRWGAECNRNSYMGIWSVWCLITPGLSTDIQCHVWACSFLSMQITRSDLRPKVKYVVSLVIADGQFIFLMCLCEYIWVNIFNLSPSRACTWETAAEWRRLSKVKQKTSCACCRDVDTICTPIIF